MRFPIGIQTFSNIREDGYFYVDKTAYIPELMNASKFIFLSRPRRFGKSLLLSTLDAYFSGRKELFEGLAISKIEKEWRKHPVLRIDFNTGYYANVEGLRNHLHSRLSDFEKLVGHNPDKISVPDRFSWIISELHRQTGEKVVILIDEYEKPILEAIGNRQLQELFRAELKPFYGCLKSCDEHIKFAMMTGVTKYGHLSVFSDLNNIADISLEPKFAAICGITHDELKENFNESLHDFAKEEGVTHEELFELLVKQYDSYRFSRKEIKVFNPFSLLNALNFQSLKDYWFMSGTPTFLVKLIQSDKINLSKLEKYHIEEEYLYGSDAEYSNPIPVLYQSGYLTIKEYNRETGIYTLGYPNLEVRRGFLRHLLQMYNGNSGIDNTNLIYELAESANDGHPELLMRQLNALISGVPFSRDETRDEYWFRDMVYLIFRLLSLRIEVERHISTGRLDCVIETKGYVYVIELKYDKTAEEALEQIEERGYALPYEDGKRKVYKIGVNYNPTARQLIWKFA